MNYSLNVKSSNIVHTLLSNCVKLLSKVQKLLIKCISYSVISKRIRVVSPKFYRTAGPDGPDKFQVCRVAWLAKALLFDSILHEIGPSSRDLALPRI